MVQVDVEDTHVDIMATIPKCWMAWIVSGIWPTIFLIGDITKLIIIIIFTSPLVPRTHCAELLHWYGYTPRGESATGEATIDILFMSC